ncbi:MAG TPA: NADH-quinone oxidoreductase subunit B family protein [Symbiobacteriaceae bacterium]|jgi:NADH-quinone oxidoreductase subunit B
MTAQMPAQNEVFRDDGGFVTTTVDSFLRWAQSNSIWPLTFGLACCAIEMMNLVAPRYDIARFGSEALRASPRQADLMFVSGRLCNKMVPVIRQVYQQMPEPKWVVAFGACASSGGVFDNYAVVQGVDNVLPVDIYVPGCPPTPEAVIDAVEKLRVHIRQGDLKGGLARNG